MNFRVFALCLVAVGCAQQNSSAEGSLIENHGPTASQVKGLLRSAEGPFVRGNVETLTAVYDAARVRSLSWSATGGALSATACPAPAQEVTITVTRQRRSRRSREAGAHHPHRASSGE